ncbi:MAG: LysR family transcriptional regulator [Acidobacteriota bacterium]
MKVFRVVATHLNFSRAAEELHITQPSVSQQIRELEASYGAPLFQRTGAGVTLTPCGAALLPFAQQLKEISDEAFAAVVAAGGEQAGWLAIGASQTIGQYLLPNLVAGFLRENPRVNVTAMSGNSDAMLEAVTTHRIHLALIEGPALRKDVHTEAFMEDELVLVVPAQHPWADQEVEIQTLKDAPFLMREFGSGSRRIVENALTQAGLKSDALNIHMELDSTEGLLNAVAAGLGFTFASRWAVRDQLSLHTLRLARVRGLKLTRKFMLAYPAGHSPTCNAAAFRLHLLTHAREFAARKRRKLAQTA